MIPSKEVSYINPELFSLNQRLTIDVEIGKNIERYTSRIEGVLESQLYIAMPMRKSVPVIVLPGTVFTGRIIVDNTVWQFLSAFIDNKFIPIPIWVIKYPYDIKKVQLRTFVRIQTCLPVLLQVLSEGPVSQPIQVLSRDISGGGVQLVLKNRLAIGSKLKLSLDLSDLGSVDAIGEVVRVDQPTEPNIYWVAVKFTEIQERNRKKIIQYTFRKQCQWRQKDI